MSEFLRWFFFHYSFPLISSVITILIIIYFYVEKKYIYDYSNAIPVIDLLSSLYKICPLSSSNKWKLLSLDCGSLRCWDHAFSMPYTNEKICLNGSAIVVTSSSSAVGSIISDMTKWADWNPFHTSQLIVKSFSDRELRRDHYMEADQILSINRKTNGIESQTVMYRFHVYADNKAGCILFWNIKQLDFMFFLIQPVKNNSEFSQCLVTHIIGFEKESCKTSASVISQRLRNIQDLLSHSSLNIVPLPLKPEELVKYKSAVGAIQPSSQEKYFSLATSRVHKRVVKNTVFVLVPFLSSAFMFNKKSREYKLGVKNIDNPMLSNQSNAKITVPKKILRHAVSDIGTKIQNIDPLTLSKTLSVGVEKESSKENLGSGSKSKGVYSAQDPKQASGTTSEDSEAKSSGRSKNKLIVKKSISKDKLRSFSETALSKCEVSSDCELNQNSQNYARLKDIDEKPEETFLAMHSHDQKDLFNSSVSDFDVLEINDILEENSEFFENRIASLMTQGNYGASELQAEVLLASQFEQCLNSGNFQTCRGWMFHSHFKGLTVLGKTSSSQFLQITSFLCQTELPVSLKDAWKFVKCPQFRFICDETVKLVEVLEKLSSSQKIIHAYHEVGGFLRKELVDFCLLQTERIELNKCYSCFYSIEYDKCPFMNSVTRGTLRPSGWIVEGDEKALRSNVTYMVQMISNPDSLLLQELSTLVAQAVHNMKNYITARPV